MVFILSALWWIRIRGLWKLLDGRDWLWEKLGLVLMGRAVFSQSVQFSQFSCSVMSSSLRPHESQHARPPCPSLSPGVHSDSCPLSWWCHLAISSSVVPFSSCPQSLPASESFPTSQLFAWGGQSIGVSALASFLPKNTQGWSLLEWTGWSTLNENLNKWYVAFVSSYI